MDELIPELSIVVPCHNEEGNLEALAAEIRDTLAPLAIPYEVVITDDGSTDRSWDVLRKIACADTNVRIQRFETNCGESGASWAGIQAARAQLIITLDADRQNDPREIPRFLDALRIFDCVCGMRTKDRGHGDSQLKIVSSRVANWVRNTLTGDRIADSGCTYRAFRRECIERIRAFNGMHRFLPTLIRMEGHTVTEIAISNRPRTSGRSHYGIWKRGLTAFIDLLAVCWMRRRMLKYRIVDAQ